MQALNELTPEQKYSADGPFMEPLVRCDACQELLFVADIRKHGMCGHCSNTRVRNVRTMTEPEMAKVKSWVNDGKLDADWAKLFGVLQ